jgi:hypothetical protein
MGCGWGHKRKGGQKSASRVLPIRWHGYGEHLRFQRVMVARRRRRRDDGRCVFVGTITGRVKNSARKNRGDQMYRSRVWSCAYQLGTTPGNVKEMFVLKIDLGHDKDKVINAARRRTTETHTFSSEEKPQRLNDITYRYTCFGAMRDVSGSR